MFSHFAPLLGRNLLKILPFDELRMRAAPLEQNDSTLYGETSICLEGNNQPIHVLYSISHVVEPSGEWEGTKL